MGDAARPKDTGHHLVARFAHAHYLANALLTLPLPVLLTYHLALMADSDGLDRNTLLAVIAAPTMLAFSVVSSRWDFAESLFQNICWNLKVFNATGLFFTRSNLGLSAIQSSYYAVAWLLVSFFFPQPAYLGPSNLIVLTSEAFDEAVAMIPPAPDLNLSSSNPIVELPEVKSYDKRRRESPVWSVVLFHAEWSRKSRELEITLSRLSFLYTSPTLAFYILTPESAPQTFYDLSLSVHATSLDLPVLYLYHHGKTVSRLPKGLAEVGSARRKAKELAKVTKRKARREAKTEESESESGSELDGSDEERENEKGVAMERYKWDRSGGSIVEAFRLEERSGIRL